MFNQLRKDIKDNRKLWEMDLIELETDSRKTKKMLKYTIGIAIFFTVVFFISQLIQDFSLMLISMFYAIIMMLFIAPIILIYNQINFYIYEKKKERGLL